MKKVFVILFILLVINAVGFIQFGADTASVAATETSLAYAADQDVQPSATVQKDSQDELMSNSNLAILGFSVLGLIMLRSRSTHQ